MISQREIDAVREENIRIKARVEHLDARQYALAYAIAGGEDAHGLLDSVATDDLVKMIRDERAQQAAWNDATAKLAREDALREAAVVAQGRYEAWGEAEPEVSCDVTACENIATAILALINKEPKP